MWFRGEDNRETCHTKGPGLGWQRSKSDDDEEEINPDKTTERKALKTMKFSLSVSRHWTPFSTNENDSNSMLKKFDILSNTSPNELRLCSDASANKTEQKFLKSFMWEKRSHLKPLSDLHQKISFFRENMLFGSPASDIRAVLLIIDFSKEGMIFRVLVKVVGSKWWEKNWTSVLMCLCVVGNRDETRNEIVMENTTKLKASTAKEPPVV